MDRVKFIVRGNPIAQKRHRSQVRNGIIHNYDPSSDDKDDLLLLSRDNAPDKPTLGPVRLDIRAYFARPKSHYGTGRNEGQLKNSAPRWHINKPDKDNVTKIVMDALTGVFWRDDSQVFTGETYKGWTDTPRFEIDVTFL